MWSTFVRPWFFREWLNRGGILELKGSWHYDAQAKQLQVVLDQTQSQGLYRMPIEIGITVPSSATSQPEVAGSRVGRTALRRLELQRC